MERLDAGKLVCVLLFFFQKQVTKSVYLEMKCQSDNLNENRTQVPARGLITKAWTRLSSKNIFNSNIHLNGLL